jgi:hypothetical protein
MESEGMWGHYFAIGSEQNGFMTLFNFFMGTGDHAPLIFLQAMPVSWPSLSYGILNKILKDDRTMSY